MLTFKNMVRISFIVLLMLNEQKFRRIQMYLSCYTNIQSTTCDDSSATVKNTFCVFSVQLIPSCGHTVHAATLPALLGEVLHAASY